MAQLGVGLYIGVTIALFWLGAIAAERAIRSTGEDDPGWVVIDESVGLLVTMTLLPVETTTIVAGFILFRLFDIIKPLGIASLERVPGGLGVMLDDFAAGVLANMLLQLTILLPRVLT